MLPVAGESFSGRKKEGIQTRAMTLLNRPITRSGLRSSLKWFLFLNELGELATLAGGEKASSYLEGLTCALRQADLGLVCTSAGPGCSHNENLSRKTNCKTVFT